MSDGSFILGYRVFISFSGNRPPLPVFDQDKSPRLLDSLTHLSHRLYTTKNDSHLIHFSFFSLIQVQRIKTVELCLSLQISQTRASLVRL